MYYDVIMAGFGGQGIQIISQILAYAALKKGLELTFLPSYGVEKRGGRTNVTLVISDEEIGSPITNHPLSVLAKDRIAVEKFGPEVMENGLLIANTSLVPSDLLSRGDITTVGVPCNDEAIQMGSPKLANMIALGAFLEKTKVLEFSDIEAVIADVIPERLKEMIPANLDAVKRGMAIVAGMN